MRAHAGHIVGSILAAAGLLLGATAHAAPLPDAVTPAPAAAVRLDGPLGRRCRANADYLVHLYEKDGEDMVAAFAERGTRKADRGWDGEYAGKWLDAAALAAANLDRADLRLLADRMAERLRGAQAPDGYMGIEGPAGRGRAPWDVWNHWYAITGWLAHHAAAGDAASLDAAAGAGRWLVAAYGPIEGPASRFFRGGWGGGCNVDIAGALVRLGRQAEDPRFLDFARAALRHYPPVRAMREGGPPPLTHAYVLCAYLGGAVEAAVAAGDADELAWVERVWTDLREQHLYPTGSLGRGEKLHAPPPVEEPDGKLQETCATVEWLLLSHRLYRATGRARYMSAVERTAYSALAAAQSSDGQAWSYYTPLRYAKPRFAGPTRCCYFSGPRGIARLPMCAFATDADGLRVDLLERATARLDVAGRAVTVRVDSDYPAAGRVAVIIESVGATGATGAGGAGEAGAAGGATGATGAAEFTVKVRVPPGVEDVRLTVNGAAVEASVDAGADGTGADNVRATGAAGEGGAGAAGTEAVQPGGHAAVRRRWSAGDRIDLAFTMPVRAEPLGEGKMVLVRGPEVLAADARDNPDVALEDLTIPARVSVEPADPAPDGRRRYAANLLAGEQTRRILLTPYADAGNDGARFTAVFAAP